MSVGFARQAQVALDRPQVTGIRMNEIQENYDLWLSRLTPSSTRMHEK